ncbi:MAG: hypothetical protein J6J38_10070 [Lachnospiraceae bacterium]|nr:hypothetical protein [Lachnospiraceae bacterium]
MKELGNVLFFILGGFVSVIFWGLLGLLFCATIIGKPLGKQLLEVAKFALHPFNDDVEVESNFAKNFVANMIFIPFGILIFLLYAMIGAAFCITLVGAPIGKVYFRLLTVGMAPFGIEVDKKHEVIKEWEEWKNW